MAWFFTEEKIFDNIINLNNEQCTHIIKSLRMKIGEELTVCSVDEKLYNCKIKDIDIKNNKVCLDVVSVEESNQEPTTRVTLYQALTKGDKMDYIIQKSVELGVFNIVPIITNRCVSRPDSKTLNKKKIRWQKISQGAAQQSRRGLIPKIETPLFLDKVIEELSQYDKVIVFYECGGDSIKNIICKEDKNIAVIIGSEGGFEETEIASIENACGKRATLGKRILRAETAPIVAMSLIMYQTGNME